VRQMLEIEVAAGRARIFRVDVQVGVEAHGAPPRSDSCRRLYSRSCAGE
jgi:hypothetical protein